MSCSFATLCDSVLTVISDFSYCVSHSKWKEKSDILMEATQCSTFANMPGLIWVAPAEYVCVVPAEWLRRQQPDSELTEQPGCKLRMYWLRELNWNVALTTAGVTGLSRQSCYLCCLRSFRMKYFVLPWKRTDVHIFACVTLSLWKTVCIDCFRGKGCWSFSDSNPFLCSWGVLFNM